MQVILASEVRRRDFSLIVSDRNALNACSHLASRVLPIDTMNVGKHLQALHGVKADFDIHAVVTFAHDAHFCASVLSSELNLHSCPRKLSEIARSKSLTRQFFRQAGCPQPRSALYKEPESAAKAIAHELDEAGQVLVKLDSSSASRGMQRITYGTPEDAITRTLEESLVLSPAGVIIEEVLALSTEEGTCEASMEFVVSQGELRLFNAVDRIFGVDIPRFSFLDDRSLRLGVEYGHINPSRRPNSYVDSVKSQLTALLRSLNLREYRPFVMKADVIATANGPIIAEITPRSSGGWDSSGSTPARGGNLHGLVLDMSLGIDAGLEAYRPRDPRFVAVASDVKADSKDCVGRSFAISGLHTTDAGALAEAEGKVRQGVFL